MYQGALRVKYNKMHKIKLKDISRENRFFCPKFGDYAIQASSAGFLTPRQIETGRRFIRRVMKKTGRMKINIFPFKSITRKPTSARMGKGKGRVSGWIVPVKSGRILFELSLVGGAVYKKGTQLKTLRSMSKKLPVHTKFVRLIY